MGDVPNGSSTVPAHCPGTQSELAGKASACAGCPNQQVCSSSPKGPDPGIELVKERLADVKHKILILSGKGGVGKSTVTAMLSRCIAKKNPDQNVAVLDIDICGPSQPRALGVFEEQVHQSGSGWSPVFVDDNLSVMSIGFLLSSPDDAIIWRGPKKNGMIKQFLSEVDWGSLDYLLIDTPPGTSDEHLSAVTYLSEADLTGAIIVTTPQEVALLDVRKEIDFCRKVNIKILGVVENMSMFVCPKCTMHTEIFPATTGGAQEMCKKLEVPFLGQIPVHPYVGKLCDEGRDIFELFPGISAVTAFHDLTEKIVTTCNGK